MGERQLPQSVYYGIQTARALENFPISGLKPLPEYVEACVLIKRRRRRQRRAGVHSGRGGQGDCPSGG